VAFIFKDLVFYRWKNKGIDCLPSTTWVLGFFVLILVDLLEQQMEY